MSIAEEIGQERFESEHQKAVINVLYTGSWLYNLQAAQLKAFDLTPEQFNVLRILRGSHPKPLHLADITCRMIDKSSNATRLVEKLRKKGMVSRTVCESNRRQVEILITKKGLSVLDRINSESMDWARRLKEISPEEASALSNLLDKLRGQI